MSANNYYLLYLSFFLLLSQSAKSQICNPSSQEQLDVNEVDARLLNNGVWRDQFKGYVVPRPDPGEDSVSAILAGGIWIGGMDDAGNLKMSRQTYYSQESSYWPGPIENSSGLAGDCSFWDKHFKVYGAEIDLLRADFADNGVIDDIIPNSLLGWPGRGNSHFASINGFSLPDQDLAPFYDQDNDNIYDPESGDYPILGLEGCNLEMQYADQMVWYILNDISTLPLDSLGLEVQVMAYAFTRSDLEYSTFYTYDVINKVGGNLNQVYFGQFVDPELGCWENDYVGCDPGRSMTVVYNAEATDPDCQYFSGSVSLGYGNEVPLIGFDFLKGPTDDQGNNLPMTASITYLPGGRPSGFPSTDAEFYGYMTGTWRDGSPVEYGGNGYQQGTYPTTFMYPDDPTDAVGWSECSAGNNMTGRTFVMSTGPFSMPQGTHKEITVGVVFVPDVPHPCPSFSLIQQADDIVQAQFDDCFGSGILSGNKDQLGQVNPLDKIQLVPNPVSYDGVIQITNLPSNSIVDFCTLEGRPIHRMKNEVYTEGETLVWDLKTDLGRPIASGLYFLRVRSGDYERVLKLSVF